MWSNRAPKEFKLFITLFIPGLFLGNIVLVVLSLIPLMYTAVCYLFDPPGDIEISREEDHHVAFLGEEVPVRSKVRVGRGVGIVTLGEKVPDPFKLTQGNNFHILWKGPKPLETELEYTLQCTVRGNHSTQPLEYESIHFSGMDQTVFGRDESKVEFVVQHRPTELKRIRDHRLHSRIPMPLGAVSKLGSQSDDFREIREYTYGDLFKNVNWKATLRLGRDVTDPVVNDFEREGMKTIWIMLDAGSRMEVGSNMENAFEHAVEACSGLTGFYIHRGCRVGLYAFNHGKMIVPDTGRRQEAMINKLLMEIKTNGAREPLRQALARCRGHMTGSSPLVILVTMVRPDNCQDIKDGVKDILSSLGPKSKVMVIHVNGNAAAAENRAEELAATALGFDDLPGLRSLRASGAFVVSWNPKEQSIARLMMLGVKRRG